MFLRSILGDKTLGQLEDTFYTQNLANADSIFNKKVNELDKRLQNIKYTKERMELYFDRLSKRNKVKNTIIKVSSQNKNTRDNKKDNLDTKEYSDIAKKEYIKKNENASSIEWEE